MASQGENKSSSQDAPREDPSQHYDRFYRLSYYYGDKAARRYYGLWSPPIGCVNPYGSNPDGIMPLPEKEKEKDSSEDEIEWEEVDFQEVDRQLEEKASRDRKGSNDRGENTSPVDGARFSPVTEEQIPRSSKRPPPVIEISARQRPKVLVETVEEENIKEEKPPRVPQFPSPKVARKKNPYILQRPSRASLSNLGKGPDSANIGKSKWSNAGSAHIVNDGSSVPTNASKAGAYHPSGFPKPMWHPGKVSSPVAAKHLEKPKSLYQPLEFVCVSPDKKSPGQESRSPGEDHVKSGYGSPDSKSSIKSSMEKRGGRVFLTGKNRGKTFKYVKLFCPEYALNSMGYCKSVKQSPWADLEEYLRYLVDSDSQYREDIIGFYEWVESHVHAAGDDTSRASKGSSSSWSKEGTGSSPVKLLDDVEIRSHYEIMNTIFESPQDSAPVWFEIMNRTRFVISKKGLLSDESDFSKRVELMRSCWFNLRRSIETNDLWHYNLFFKEMMYYVMCFHPGWMNKILTQQHKKGFYAGEDPEHYKHNIL